MNLFRCRASHGRVAVGDAELDDLPVADGDVLVGIRPEGLRPVGVDHAGPVVEVTVEVVEPLGDEVLVHGSIEARGADMRVEAEEATLLSDAADGDRATIILRLPPDERPKAGSQLRVAIARKMVRLFDVASGLAIRSE
jgi:ABC-type sugar transport system ATPase subunit